MVGENNKVVIVTGGSSGIGRCTASALKENGCIVYEFSRRSIPMEGVTHLSVDVINEDAVNAAVQQVIQKETKIDAVINCAGFGISGAVEFTSMEQAKAQFDVNFFGTVTVNKAVLPFLRHQGKGHIVNISSVAAVAHIPFQTFYSASKAAVSSYSYALENEVKPYGIHVTVVELGDICTGFTKARQKSILGDEEYGGRISRSVSQMEHDEQNGMDPARIGRYIAGIVEKKKPAVVYVVGAQYKFLSLLCKLLPAAARGKIVGENIRVTGASLCKLRIQLLDLRQLLQPGFIKGSFRRLVQGDFFPMSFQKIFAVPRLAVGIIDRVGLGIVDNMGF